METPSTAQKRKYNAYEEPRSDGATETEDEGSKDAYSGSEYERTPTKRLKSTGIFEQTGKRKENGQAQEEEPVQSEKRSAFKRRRM